MNETLYEANKLADLIAQRQLITYDVVEQTAKHPVHAKPLPVYEQDFRRVLMSVMAKDRRAVEIAASPEQFTHEPKATCNSMVLLYNTILSLPDTALSAGLLRSMAAEVANPQ